MERRGPGCDVFGERYDAKRYSIGIYHEDGTAIMEKTVDFCVRAVERAQELIDRACSPPT